MQGVARKDTERAFGVLQARLAIFQGPSHFWNKNFLTKVMNSWMTETWHAPLNTNILAHIVRTRRHTNHIQTLLKAYRKFEDWFSDHQLKEDLIQRHWQLAMK